MSSGGSDLRKLSSATGSLNLPATPNTASVADHRYSEISIFSVPEPPAQTVIEIGAGNGTIVSPMSLSTILAAYAAILSTVAIGWLLYRELSDRIRVNISVALTSLLPGGDERQFPLFHPNEVAGAYVLIKITNAGHRPVTLQGWGGEWKTPQNGKDKFTVISQGLPRILNGHESHQEFTPDLSVVSPNIKALFVRDSSDKNWYLPEKELQDIVEQAHRYVSAPEQKHQ